MVVDFKSKTNMVLEEGNGEFQSNKGTILKKFYQEKELIEKTIKQSEVNITQFINDMRSI